MWKVKITVVPVVIGAVRGSRSDIQDLRPEERSPSNSKDAAQDPEAPPVEDRA